MAVRQLGDPSSIGALSKTPPGRLAGAVGAFFCFEATEPWGDLPEHFPDLLHALGVELLNMSIVLKIVYGETNFLFSGDIEWEAEHDLVDVGYDLSATVLKVAHHGSVTSAGYVFLREVMPQYAVTSAGKDNAYGHPEEAVLSRLRDEMGTMADRLTRVEESAKQAHKRLDEHIKMHPPD